MMGVSSPGKSYLSSSSRTSISTSSEQLGVVDHVALVHEHDDVGHAHLARQQDVLARLRHRAVGGRHTRMAPSICAAPVIMFLT
jgi:hypothetical protein